jgi:DNA modification methylase
MKIKNRKITDLIAAEYNPRELTAEQHQQLKDSLSRFGMVDPVIVNTHPERENIIVGGHQRAKVWSAMGNDTIPTVEVKLTPAKERELNIRLNKNSGQWDEQALQEYFNTDELVEWGFDNEELKFFEPETTEGLIDDDEIPEVTEAITQEGDLWILGEHRLLCGDSTKQEDVERLMDGNKADMVFTDPPYGIDVVGNGGNIGGDTKNAKAGRYKKVINDDKEYNPNHLFPMAENLVVFGANYFSDKLPKGQWIVWDKNRPEGTTFSDCELAWTTGKGIAINKYKCTWDGFHREGESGKRFHPTQKPIKLFVDIFNDYQFDICIDPFLGSGSTLIACEKTNRKCYGMELDPHYCDVIVKRWEEYTGKKAEKTTEMAHA